ncbi:rCG27240 [Rattus norvegicus]|uniref:RCG27240 n=1 Tax=Rattus norvegicus TaxID=10116 RepID=A6HMC0_RAT|nr:rCG27240 [Rattus norvegicus]
MRVHSLTLNPSQRKITLPKIRTKN